MEEQETAEITEDKVEDKPGELTITISVGIDLRFGRNFWSDWISGYFAVFLGRNRMDPGFLPIWFRTSNPDLDPFDPQY